MYNTRRRQEGRQVGGDRWRRLRWAAEGWHDQGAENSVRAVHRLSARRGAGAILGPEGQREQGSWQARRDRQDYQRVCRRGQFRK